MGEQDHGIDLFAHYRWAVQDPDTHAQLLEIIYERVRDGRSPVVLREDFAGTCAESVAWISHGADRSALAIDLDGEALRWARRRAERSLGAGVERLTLVESDVFRVAPPEVPEADVISVLNFSVCYFDRRAALLRYLEHARRCLAPHGVLVLNLFGGASTSQRGVQRHRVCPGLDEGDAAPLAPFDYLWEQRAWDAVTQVLDCRMHFALDAADGVPPREVRDAFRYRFRLWGLAEMREAMLDAGFSEVQIWRHTWDAARGEDGLFLGAVDALEEAERWTAYVVALR